MSKLKFTILFCIAISLCNAQVSDFEAIDFKKADRTAKAFHNASLENLQELVNNLTVNLPTDVERFRSIYKWVCTNIENDYKLYSKNKRKRHSYRNDSIQLNIWNAHFKTILFEKMVGEKKTICTGYAYLVKAMSDLAGLDCKIIHGYGRTSITNIETLNYANHSWNAIKLNGKWYLCDPTWASGKPHPEYDAFTFNYNDGFFLADPELFVLNHYPEDSSWLLTDCSVSFEEFKAYPVFYTTAYKHIEQIINPKKLYHRIQKKQSLMFDYVLKQDINPNDISLHLDDGVNIKRLKPKQIALSKNRLKFEHQFNRLGFFDVHIYLKNNIIATYVVQVKRRLVNASRSK